MYILDQNHSLGETIVKLLDVGARPSLVSHTQEIEGHLVARCYFERDFRSPVDDIYVFHIVRKWEVLQAESGPDTALVVRKGWLWCGHTENPAQVVLVEKLRLVQSLVSRRLLCLKYTGGHIVERRSNREVPTPLALWCTHRCTNVAVTVAERENVLVVNAVEVQHKAVHQEFLCAKFASGDCCRFVDWTQNLFSIFCLQIRESYTTQILSDLTSYDRVFETPESHYSVEDAEMVAC